MTVTSTELVSSGLAGATCFTVGLYQLNLSTALQRILAANPLTGRVLVYGVNESQTQAALIARTPRMDPPPTRIAVPAEPSPFFYILRPKTSSKQGRITQFLYDIPTTPSLNVQDSEAGGDILVTPDDQWVIHTRIKPGTLVVRAASTLDVVFEHRCCENPSRIVVDAVNNQVFVFSSTSRKVWVFGYSPTTGELSFMETVVLPYVTGLLDVSAQNGRLVYVTGDRLVVIALTAWQDRDNGAAPFEVLHSYHDPYGAFTSVEGFYPPAVVPVVEEDDGSTDPAYLRSLDRYRFSNGRDRKVRDPWDSRHFLGRIRAVVGTTNGTGEGDPHPWGRAIVRQFGKTRISLDPVQGRLVVYGELTFWFRSILDPGLVPAVADADVSSGQRMSIDAARGLRLAWTGNPTWKPEPSTSQRAVYFDGATHALATSLKTPLLPGPAGTIMAWIYYDPDAGTDTGLNVVVAQTLDPSNPFLGNQWLGYNPDTEEIEFMGETASAVALSIGWHHIAGTYNGGTIRIFLDGVQVEVALNTAIWDPSAPVQMSLGAAVDLEGVVTSPFGGWIGDVLVYATEKLASFFADVFARGPGGSAPPLPTDQLPLATGLDSLLLDDGNRPLLE